MNDQQMREEHWRQWGIAGMPKDKQRLAEATWQAAMSASATTSQDDGDLTVAYMAGVYDERKRTVGECESAEIIRLREDCAEAYQVIGALAGDRFNDADVEKALDNIVAAANGTPRPHADVLPFSHQRTGKESLQDAEELRAFKQAVLDPENQPSQFGTMLLDDTEPSHQSISEAALREALVEHASIDGADEFVKFGGYLDDFKALLRKLGVHVQK